MPEDREDRLDLALVMICSFMFGVAAMGIGLMCMDGVTFFRVFATGISSLLFIVGLYIYWLPENRVHVSMSENMESLDRQGLLVTDEQMSRFSAMLKGEWPDEH